MRKHIKALLKFTKEEQFQSDLINGLLFFRSIADVRNVNDTNDGVYSKIKGQYCNVPYVVTIDTPQMMLQPVCCFYSISSEDLSDNLYIKLGEQEANKLKENFGNYVTIITDVSNFINKVSSSPFKINCGQCIYSDEIFSEKIGFSKDSDFADEKEYRFLIEDMLINSPHQNLCIDYYKDYTILDKCFFLNIGNISNITQRCTVDDLLKGIYVKVKFSQELNDEIV